MAGVPTLSVESFRLRIGPVRSHLDYRINPGIGDHPLTLFSFPSHIIYGPGHAPLPPVATFQSNTVRANGANMDVIDMAKQEGLGNHIPMPQVCLLALDL